VNRPYRYAFVLGTGRCGSTMVQEVLARHPDVGFVTNLDDRFGLLSRRCHIQAYRRLPARVTQKGRVRFAPSEAYRGLGREAAPVLADPFRDLLADDVTPWLARRVSTFFHRRASVQQFPVFLHKFTGWPRSGLIDAALPESRFLNIVRDGRAVANSWLQMPWWRGHLGPERWHFGPLPSDQAQTWEASGRSLTVLAGLAWSMLMQSYDDAASHVGTDRWLTMRYEDVVRNPQESFAAMADFLGLQPSAEFRASVDRITFSGARSDAFYVDLGPGHVATLDRTLGPALERCGYV